MFYKPHNIYKKLSLMDRLNRLWAAIGGIFVLFGMAGILIIIAAFSSSLFELSPLYKYIYLAVSVLILALIIFRYTLYPLIRKTDYSHLSRRVELFHPELKDTLSAAVELRDNLKNNREGYSPDLIRSVIDEASKKAADLDFNSCLDKSSTAKKAKLGTAIIVIVIGLFLLYPSAFLYGIKDFSSPSVIFKKPTPFILSAIPGDAEILKGDDITVGAVIKKNPLYKNGKISPKKLEMVWNYVGNDNEHILPMTPVEKAKISDSSLINASFVAKVENVNQPFNYKIISSETESEKYNITVVDKPKIVSIKQRLIYPSYTHLPTTTIDTNDGNITALPGTKVVLNLKSNKSIIGGKAVFASGYSLPISVYGDSAKLTFRVKSDDSYHFEIIDSDSLTNPNPIAFRIFATPDLYPEVEISSPGKDLVIGDISSLPLLIKGKDDFGFSSMKLTYQTKGSDMEQTPITVDIPFVSDGENDIAVGYNWDLTGLGLIPGDEVTYFVTVTDNDSYSGPKTAESKHYSIRIPSVDQILADFDSKQEESTDDLEKVITEQEDLNKKVLDLKREMMQLEKTDWEKNRQIEEALKKQKEISNTLDDIQKNIEDNIEKIKQNKLNTEQILEKSQRIAELLDEINSPELKGALEKLQKALQNLDRNAIQKALENLQFSQEDYLKRLEQTLEMLKRLRAEQKFDQLKQLADKMAAEQKEIKKELESSKNTDLDHLANRQDEIKNKLEAFNKGLDKMQELNKESPVIPDEDLQSVKAQADSSGLKEDMQKSSQNMRSGKKQQASGSCKSASKKLDELAANMQSLMNQMQSGQLQELVRLLRKAFNDVVYLSQNQEDLRGRIDSAAPYDSLIRNLAAPQHYLEQNTEKVHITLDSLYQLEPRLDPSLGNDLTLASGRMSEAIDRLELKSKSAVVSQSEALKHLNRAGFKLLQILRHINSNSSSSGGGTCQKPGQGGSTPQLSDLAQQQGEINAQTSSLAQQLRRTASQQEMLARMAAEQEAVRQGLRELLQEGDLGSSGKLGRLDDLNKDMKKVIDDFQKNMVNRNTLRRQERILTRLLDAKKALKTQGYKKERKAEVGKNVIRSGPARLADTRSEIQGKLKRLREALNENYPPEYREMIKSYIEALTSELAGNE